MLNLNNKDELTTKVRDIIYDYIYESFGESEANNPSWYIPTLAEYIVNNFLDKDYNPKHTYYNSDNEEVSY